MHGEVTDPAVDFFDREKVFIERHLRPLVEALPDLKVLTSFSHDLGYCHRYLRTPDQGSTLMDPVDHLAQPTKCAVQELRPPHKQLNRYVHVKV